LRARLYLIDAETAQSASALGNALRITAIPSRCPRDSGPIHVIRRAPQQLGERFFEALSRKPGETMVVLSAKSACRLRSCTGQFLDCVRRVG
jgi:hypothetical protein